MKKFMISILLFCAVAINGYSISKTFKKIFDKGLKYSIKYLEKEGWDSFGTDTIYIFQKTYGNIDGLTLDMFVTKVDGDKITQISFSPMMKDEAERQRVMHMMAKYMVDNNFRGKEPSFKDNEGYVMETNINELCFNALIKKS